MNDITVNSDKILITIRAEEKIAEAIEAFIIEREKEILGDQNGTIVVKMISTRCVKVVAIRIDRGIIDLGHQCLLLHHHK